MTQQQKRNSLADFYEKPARKARLLSKEDFTRSMRWGSVVWFLIGMSMLLFGVFGMIAGVTTDKPPLVFAMTGSFFCISAVLMYFFPGFRRFFDGGTFYDMFNKEAGDLAAAWAQTIPEVKADQLNIKDPLFWGTTKAMSCIVLVKWDRSEAGGDEFFLAAHCDKSRYAKMKPSLGQGKCIGLSHVFSGSFEDIEQQVKDLTDRSVDTMRGVIAVNPKMQLDPLLYAPFSEMLCPRS